MKQYSLAQSQKGLTLVEIMIAVTISLVLLAGIIQIFLSSKQSYNIQQALSRVQENARLVSDLMLRDITAAGYLGCLGATDEVVNTLADQTANFNFATGIEGDEGGNGNPDSITIRRVIEGMSIPVVEPMVNQTAPIKLDTGNLSYASLNQYDVVTVSDCSGAAVFMITNEPGTDGFIEHDSGTGYTAPTNTPNAGQYNASDDLNRVFGSPSATTAKIYRVASSSYQVLPSESGRTTSLYLSGEELIEGVEDLQIQYGIANNPANPSIPTIAEQYVDADAVTDWNDVMAVRITFVVNSADLIVNPGDGDGRLKKTFTTTIRLRNRVPA
ncbi:PilW family protein [Kaarinaea lacus]